MRARLVHGLFNPFDPSFPFNSLNQCDGNPSSDDSSDESAAEDDTKTIQTLKKKCKKWQQKCGHLKVVLKETKKKGQIVRMERDHFCAEKKKFFAAYELVRATNERIEAHNKDLQHQNELNLAVIDEKNEMCAVFENICEKYTKLAIKNDGLEERVKLMRKENLCMQNSKKIGDRRRILNIKKNMKQELDGCKKKVTKVQKICSDHTRKTQELLEMVKEKNQFYDEVRIENEYLTQVNEDLSDANEVVNKKFEILKEKFDSFIRKDYDEIRSENASTMTENDSLRREIETMRKELEICVGKNELCADYDTVCADNAKYASENIRLRCRIGSLRKELESCKDEINTICGYQDIHRDDNTKLSKENAVLRQVNKQIKEEIERVRENHRIVSKKYNDLKTLSVQDIGPSGAVAINESHNVDR